MKIIRRHGAFALAFITGDETSLPSYGVAHLVNGYFEELRKFDTAFQADAVACFNDLVNGASPDDVVNKVY